MSVLIFALVRASGDPVDLMRTPSTTEAEIANIRAQWGLDKSYVEQYWLGILGPSTTWLLRRLAAGLEANPEGFDLPLAATAQALGLGGRGGRHSPFMRAFTRCCQFDLAEARSAGAIAVRRKLPPLNRRQVQRLPAHLQESHQAWQEDQLRTPAADQLRPDVAVERSQVRVIAGRRLFEPGARRGHRRRRLDL